MPLEEIKYEREDHYDCAGWSKQTQPCHSFDECAYEVRRDVPRLGSSTWTTRRGKQDGKSASGTCSARFWRQADSIVCRRTWGSRD